MNESNDSRDILLNQLADEFAARLRAGERPCMDEYCERHPELAADIRTLFPALIELEQAKAAGGPELLGVFSDTPPVSQLGDFRLLREVGRGGMGVVYEAEQVSLGRRVAIKLLPSTVFQEPTKRLRFEREAKSAAKLHHSNIVPVHGIGEHEGTPYYVMQFISGLGLDAVIEELRRLPGSGRMSEPTRSASRGASNLSVALARSLADDVPPGKEGVSEALVSPVVNGARRGPSSSSGSSPSRSVSGVHLPGQPLSSLDGTSIRKTNYWESVARIGVQVAGALSYAHKLGILHRDIKPANLLLDLDAVVWVTDFGLAKAADNSDDLTHTGDLVGTLRYMPPEAFEGKSDARSDIYALGLTLFEMVALRPAYHERDRNKLIKELTVGDPPRLKTYRREAPRDLVTIIEKACDRNPARRYQSAGAMAVDLQFFLDGRPIIARRPSDVERVWMWARRRPAMAVMVTAFLLCLLIGSVVSTRFAIQADRFSREAIAREKEATDARDSANFSRLAELSQRQVAEKEKNRADLQLADMYTSRGLLACERDAFAEAALWSTAAAEQSIVAGDRGREADNRIRARNGLRQAILPLASLQFSGDVNQIVIQPHGELILIRNEKRLILWSWREDKRLPWTENLNEVMSAQFSPDGQSLALGFHSGEAQIRDPLTGKVRETIPTGQVFILSYSPNGKFLVLTGTVLRIWDVERKSFINPGWQHPEGVTAVAFNQSGDRLLTSSFDHQARVFAVERGKDRNGPLFEAVSHNIRSAPLLIDNDRTLVTITETGEFARWDMVTGKPAGPAMKSQSSVVHTVAGSRDGKWFVLNGLSGPELIPSDFRQSARMLSHTNAVEGSAFSPDNSMLLTVSWDQTARLWSIPRGAPIGPPLKHMANVEHCSWAHDNRHFVTAQNDGLIRVWQLPQTIDVIAREKNWGKLMRARASFDGRLAVAGIWHEAPMEANPTVRLIRVLKTENGQLACPDIPLPGGLVDSCVCADNTSVAAILERDGKGLFGVWDITSGKSRFEPIPLPSVPLSVATRPNHHHLAVLCKSGEQIVFDDRSGKRLFDSQQERSTEPAPRANQLQYTPDGQSFVSLKIQNPSSIEVRDAETGRLRFPPIHPSLKNSNIHSFACSADSRYLATTSLVNNHVQVWDLSTGQPVSEPLLHPGDFWGIFSVRFSPDGRFVLTSHKDGQMRYWNWKEAKLACPAMVHDNEVMDAAFTADGKYAIAAVRGRPELHVWELMTGRRVAPPIRLTQRENISALAVDLTPDGRKAFVSYLPADLAVVDLENVLSQPSLSTTDMAQLAELTTARHIELGDLSGLTTGQWVDRWDRFRERNSEWLRSMTSTSRLNNRQ